MGATVTKVDFSVTPGGQDEIAECVGEHVTFTEGQFNIVRRFAPNKGGGMQYLFHRNVMSGLGVGDVTGTRYRATGHIQANYSQGTADGSTATFTLVLNVVAQDGSGQFTARATVHLTVLPSGEEVAYVDVFEVRCR